MPTVRIALFSTVGRKRIINCFVFTQLHGMSAFSHCYTSLESVLKAKWRMIRPPAPPTISTHVYKIRPRADKRGVDLISDTLRYSPLWYAGPNAVSNAISFAKFNSRPHNAVIRVFDETGTVIETDEKTAPKPAGASGRISFKEVKKKRQITPERRAQLSAAMKARWAAKRAAATATPQQNSQGQTFTPEETSQQ